MSFVFLTVREQFQVVAIWDEDSFSRINRLRSYRTTRQKKCPSAALKADPGTRIQESTWRDRVQLDVKDAAPEMHAPQRGSFHSDAFKIVGFDVMCIRPMCWRFQESSFFVCRHHKEPTRHTRANITVLKMGPTSRFHTQKHGTRTCRSHYFLFHYQIRGWRITFCRRGDHFWNADSMMTEKSLRWVW